MIDFSNQRVITTTFVLVFIAAVYLGVTLSKEESQQPVEVVTRPAPEPKMELVEKSKTKINNVVEVRVSSKLHINNATAAEIAGRLSGIGIKTAQLIVDHRKRHGLFESFDDLATVKGIGPAKIKDNRDEISFEIPEQ